MFAMLTVILSIIIAFVGLVHGNIPKRLTKKTMYYNLLLAQLKASMVDPENPTVIENSFLTALSKKALPTVLGVFAMLIFIIWQIIFEIWAISIDPYKYPSLFMVALTFVALFVGIIRAKFKEKKNLDLTTELGKYNHLADMEKIRPYTLWGFFAGLLNFTYYIYIFLVLTYPEIFTHI